MVKGIILCERHGETETPEVMRWCDVIFAIGINKSDGLGQIVSLGAGVGMKDCVTGIASGLVSIMETLGKNDVDKVGWLIHALQVEIVLAAGVANIDYLKDLD